MSLMKQLDILGKYTTITHQQEGYKYGHTEKQTAQEAL